MLKRKEENIIKYLIDIPRDLIFSYFFTLFRYMLHKIKTQLYFRYVECESSLCVVNI